VLFLDAAADPASGAKEGVLVAWGYDETGQRVLVDVVLGQRERFENWPEMGRGRVRRGLGGTDANRHRRGAGVHSGDGGAVAGQRSAGCTVHRLRNLVGKLPKRDAELRTRIEAAYWAALDEDSSPGGRRGSIPAAGCRTGTVTIRARWPAEPRICRRSACTSPTRFVCASAALDEPARAIVGGGEEADEGDRPVPRREELPEPALGGAGPAHRSARGLALEHRQLAQMRGARMGQPPDPLSA
jgi:hypothetical protein